MLFTCIVAPKITYSIRSPPPFSLATLLFGKKLGALGGGEAFHYVCANDEHYWGEPHSSDIHRDFPFTCTMVPQTVAKIAICDYPMASSDCLVMLITKLAKMGGV